jgi:tellurium resistance protein TerD
MVENCYVRAWDDATGVELFRYDLTEKFTNEDALEFGRFTRVGNDWEFVATGKGYVGSLQKLVDLFT